MEEPTLTELLARMWVECDPNRGGVIADEIEPDLLFSAANCVDGKITPTDAKPNPLAGKPRWHWFIPRANATVAYLAKHGLEIREIGK